MAVSGIAIDASMLATPIRVHSPLEVQIRAVNAVDDRSRYVPVDTCAHLDAAGILTVGFLECRRQHIQAHRFEAVGRIQRGAASACAPCKSMLDLPCHRPNIYPTRWCVKGRIPEDGRCNGAPPRESENPHYVKFSFRHRQGALASRLRPEHSLRPYHGLHQ